MNRSKKVIISIIFILMSVFSDAQVLKVMTYNIRLDVASDGENDWSHRKDFFTSQIQFYEPDIFGVQEARPNQVIDMVIALSVYNQVGIGREGGKAKENLLIFFIKKKILELKKLVLFGYLKRQIKFQKVGMLPTIEFVRMRCSKI